MKKLQNQTALITSASKGIGLACAVKFAEEGAKVYMGVRRMEDTQKICDAYKLKGYHMVPVYFEATKQDSYSAMVDTVITSSGRLDVLVNNFGIGKPSEDLDLIHGSEDAFFELLRLNLGSVYRISKLALPHMINNHQGSIINISSIGGSIPDVTSIGYGVSKAAINNITRQIALQYARDNIRCNAVLPGLTATDAALKSMPESFLSSFLSHVPLNRMGRPEDMANAALFFACEDSSYITGHLMEVAGGYGLGTPQYADALKKNQF